MSEYEGGLYNVIFPLIALCALLLLFINSSYNSYKTHLNSMEAENTLDPKFRKTPVKLYLVDAGIAYSAFFIFLVILFIPVVSNNVLNDWLFNAIVWVKEIPVIGLLFGLGGIYIYIFSAVKLLNDYDKRS